MFAAAKSLGAQEPSQIMAMSPDRNWVWIVVRVLCRMLGRVLRGINAIPLIGGLNRILGFAFGFVSGLLNCWIWSILLWVAANLTGGKLEFLTTATLNRSVIYGLLANLNPFLTRY